MEGVAESAPASRAPERGVEPPGTAGDLRPWARDPEPPPAAPRRADPMREVLRGAAVTFVVKVLGAGLMFGFNVLVARLLGAEGAGLFYLAFTVVTVAVVFGRFGLDNTLLRFTAASAAVEDWGAVRGAYRGSVQVALVSSSVTAALLYAAAPALAAQAFLKPDLAAPLRWMAVSVVPLTLVWIHGEALKGLRRILASQTLQALLIPLLALAALLLMPRPWRLREAVWAYSLGTGGAAAAGILLWRARARAFRDAPASFPLSRILRTCLPLCGVAACNLAVNWVPFLLLGVWGTKAELGIFGAANRTATLVSFVLVAVNSIAAPTFAALHRKGDRAGLERTALRSAALMTAASAPVLAVFVAFPGSVLGLFGPEFAAGRRVLSLLALGQFVNVATGSVAYLLMMSGHEVLLRNNTLAAAALSVALGLAVIPSWGATGAALATAVPLAFMNLAAVYLVWDRLGILTVPGLQRLRRRDTSPAAGGAAPLCPRDSRPP